VSSPDPRTRDPARTVHFALARALIRPFGWDVPPGGGKDDSVLAACAADDDPGSRREYTYWVSTAWVVLAFAFLVISLLAGIAVRSLASEAAGDVIVVGGLVAMGFCLAGAANALWRSLYFVSKAKQLVGRQQRHTEVYASTMRRTLPRNSSLIFQAAVAILALVLVL
jgi:hypothetical protein